MGLLRFSWSRGRDPLQFGRARATRRTKVNIEHIQLACRGEYRIRTAPIHRSRLTLSEHVQKLVKLVLELVSLLLQLDSGRLVRSHKWHTRFFPEFVGVLGWVVLAHKCAQMLLQMSKCRIINLLRKRQKRNSSHSVG